MKQIAFILIFLAMGVEAMHSKTLACRQLESCIAEIKKTKKVSVKTMKIFRQSIENPHDDPGYYRLLSDIARKAGLGEYVYDMWDEYGITDTGRELLLRTNMTVLRQAILASLIKKKGGN